MMMKYRQWTILFSFHTQKSRSLNLFSSWEIAAISEVITTGQSQISIGRVRRDKLRLWTTFKID